MYLLGYFSKPAFLLKYSYFSVINYTTFNKNNMTNFIQNLLDTNVLRDDNGKQYILNRPLEIRLLGKHLKIIKNNYKPDSETGGFVLFKAVGTILVSEEIIFVQNTSELKSGYAPNMTFFNEALSKAFSDNLLPFTFHTHPTSLGLSNYDNKRENFYLKSSYQDRKIGAMPYLVEETKLLLPQLIFVVDERFTNSIATAIYEGGFLPVSFASVNDYELVALCVIGISLIKSFRGHTVSNILLLVSFMTILYQEARRPKYFCQGDNYVISIAE